MARLPGMQEALAMYGFVLMVCGALAFQAAGGRREARSALLVSNACAVIAFLTAAGVGAGPLRRSDRAWRRRFAFVHWALVFPVALGAVFAWRCAKAAAAPSKRYIVPYLVVMTAASLATSALVALHKPKKNPAVRAALAAREKAGRDAADAKAKTG